MILKSSSAFALISSESERLKFKRFDSDGKGNFLLFFKLFLCFGHLSTGIISCTSGRFLCSTSTFLGGFLRLKHLLTLSFSLFKAFLLFLCFLCFLFIFFLPYFSFSFFNSSSSFSLVFLHSFMYSFN